MRQGAGISINAYSVDLAWDTASFLFVKSVPGKLLKIVQFWAPFLSVSISVDLRSFPGFCAFNSVPRASVFGPVLNITDLMQNCRKKSSGSKTMKLVCEGQKIMRRDSSCSGASWFPGPRGMQCCQHYEAVSKPLLEPSAWKRYLTSLLSPLKGRQRYLPLEKHAHNMQPCQQALGYNTVV